MRAGSRRASRSRISSAISVARAGQRLGLLPVELLLLLAAVDVQLAGVGVLADPRRAVVGFGLLDAQAAQIRFDFGEPRAPRRPRARARRPAACRAVSIAVRQLAIAPREQHLLPAPQLVAQPLVAPRLGCLALQRATLLLDLEDDVVDAREVLLRGFELQLGGRGAATCTW